MKKWIQFGALFGVACVAFIAVLVFCAALLRPQTRTAPVSYPAAEVKAMEKSRDTSFDPNHLPTVQRDVDYSQGKAAPWYPKGESPLLSELVQDKKLPPVAQRVGPEPLVLEGPEGLGKYGGTWNRVANASSDVSIMTWRLSGSTLVRWSPLGYPIRPQIAKAWTVSPDRRQYTFFLRKGMKWSDGAPFTADDIIYWWKNEQLLLNSAPMPFMIVEGKAGNIEKIDDYTVKFTFWKPNSTLLENLSKFTPVYSPQHYLAKFNPKTGDQKLITATMAARGFSTPQALYTDLTDFRNPEHPRLWPWIYRTYKSSPPETFVRNPYFCGVDPQGNQLPYVDRILFDVKSPKLIPLAASNGDLTMQDRYITYDNYTLLMENRAGNNYQVYHWFPASRSAFTLWPNNNRRVFPNDPITRQKAVLLQNKTFRQALSLAINRWQIIKAIYNGNGEPAQIDPGRESEFHSEKLMKSFTQFDPARANKMLDQLGLDKRDLEGMRTFPDGQRMTWYIEFTDFTGEGPTQFVVDDWAAVGIRAIHREHSRPLFSSEKAALLHDFTVWSGESEFNPLVEPRSFVPVNSESHQSPATGVWYQRGGLFGNKAALQGGIPPLKGSDMLRSMQLLTQVQEATSRAQQIKLFRQITDIAAEDVWSISIATPPPQLTVVKNDFHNVPHNVIYGAAYNTPANAGMETFFFAKNTDSPSAIAQTKREITTITPEANAAPAPDPAAPAASDSGGGLGKLISRLIYATLALGLLLAAVRHPYIGRRLLIMIPTMLLISVITFSIIQLPPGDFVQTKVMELKLAGDDNAIKEVERLSTMFHLDEPGWKQYSRWMGFYWFKTRDEADKGLLQGNMGRSMETQKPVNDIVGDRLLLTVMVSLGTILFTWAIALPIGIYSAVRQYTTGDYLLTFLGFIGMCVPNFLLAILLMFWSKKYLGLNVTGLFSPEYAGSPDWTVGKYIDLLQHIWVPILVIATAGTAGMIRVMRGNLLDELRKPYVTTAMAKGVRPFRLLLKYPVRLALNPFISGIGAIFPQLVSGGAIVAIVLSLPMVGPVMLQGLMAQDIYLAGSMLMVLSLLGIFGTLVSDLLLLWLDPAHPHGRRLEMRLDTGKTDELDAPEAAKAEFEAEHIRVPGDLLPVEAELPHSHDPIPHGAEKALAGKVASANLSQWQLIRRRFLKHYLAVASFFLLLVLYSLALFAEFAAPYTSSWSNVEMIYAPPQLPKFNFSDGLYAERVERRIDPITLRNYYTQAPGTTPLGFFVKGEPYKMWGFLPLDRHFFGVRDKGTPDNPGTFNLLGADKYGRDILSRLIYGARISLSIGIVSILATFVFGVVIGGISGYVGGAADTYIQRLIEVINSFPQLPLWLAFAAVLPSDWSPLQTYFAITLVLSLLSWTGLARVVRGKILSLREEDYAVAARLLGASHSRIIFRHLLPGFTSHIIVSLSLSVPGMILGETALSFLGLGLRPPVVSWGVMLQECLNIDVVANYPWLLMPVMMIVLTVLAFNFFGDGMRDAADPYSSK